MDPNETLKAIRELAQTPESMEEALELFSDLDDWLCKGGFLPNAWSKHE